MASPFDLPQHPNHNSGQAAGKPQTRCERGLFQGPLCVASEGRGDLGPTLASNEGDWPQCSCEGVAGVDELWSSLSELCGGDGERCIQRHTVVK